MNTHEGTVPPAAPRAAQRSGLIAAGNFIVDQVKVIDHWPAQESLARVLSQSSHNGGGPYNVLQDLSRLGAPFPLEAAGLLGDDAAGRWIRDDCARHRIDTRRLLTTSAAATSYTDVMSERGTGRRTFFHQSGANALLAPEHVDFAGSTAKVFYLGYLLLLDALDAPRADGRPHACTVFERAKAAGLATALDCVSEDSDRFGRIVAPVLPWVDLLFANDFEVGKLTGVDVAPGGVPDESAVRAATQALLALGVREWAVVHLPAGVGAGSRRGDWLWQPSVAVPRDKIAGSNGAGDALAAGVLYGWHEGWDMGDCLRLGVSTAAASLFHPSCSEAVLPAADCLALLKTYGVRG